MPKFNRLKSTEARHRGNGGNNLFTDVVTYSYSAQFDINESIEQINIKYSTIERIYTEYPKEMSCNDGEL